jgi:predicted dehydrogenase
MSNINWGIIGCGDVTEKKSGPAFNKIQGSRLVAVMRRDASKAGDYAHRHNVPNWYDDANEMMGQEDLNAIYIATPPSSHKDYAIAALAKGFNVYVEKPVTRNAEEAREIAAALRLHPEQKLTVAHYRRAVPMFLKVKQLLESELIGEIRTVQIRMWQSRKPALVASVKDNWRVQPEFSGGGYFHDLAPHQLDLMLFYFGTPTYYKGFSLNQSCSTAADDHVCGQILFKNNVVVNGSWCFNVAESETTDSCEIIGTKGKITFPFFGNYLHWKTEGEEQKIDFVHPEHIQQPMIEKIVAYFKNQAPNPCAIDEAIVLMDIMDAFTSASKR